jgi:hypothetical protein
VFALSLWSLVAAASPAGMSNIDCFFIYRRIPNTNHDSFFLVSLQQSCVTQYMAVLYLGPILFLFTFLCHVSTVGRPMECDCPQKKNFVVIAAAKRRRNRRVPSYREWVSNNEEKRRTFETCWGVKAFLTNNVVVALHVVSIFYRLLSNYWSCGSIWMQVRSNRSFVFACDFCRCNPTLGPYSTAMVRRFIPTTIGVGKYMDPKHGWSYHADPLPALDTYTRHTVGAQYIYGLLGPQGLRVMTPLVVYIEIFAAPVALVGSYLANTDLVHLAIGLICSLHVGISMALRNAVLLSFVACAAWFVFLPLGWTNASSRGPWTFQSKLGLVVSTLLVGSMVSANIWFETIGKDCSTGSLREIWSTLLQNRWNVFIGAEEYVRISWRVGGTKGLF